MNRIASGALVLLLVGCASAPQRSADKVESVAKETPTSAPVLPPPRFAAEGQQAPAEAMGHGKQAPKNGGGGSTGRSPGEFDYYLLTLSWSPTWAQDQCKQHDPRRQCNTPFGFVVHGLWPQFADGGWPQECAPSKPLTSDDTQEASMAMPDTGLMQHEWDKHGTCSGLTPAQYFSAIAQAYGSVEIPPEFQTPHASQTVAPSDLASKFQSANPSMFPNGSLLVSCVGGTQGTSRLAEIRICLKKDDMTPMACAQSVANKVCHSSAIEIPPVFNAGGAPQEALGANRTVSHLDEPFTGKYRKEVKLTTPAGAQKSVDLASLIDSLPSDEEMLAFEPLLTSSTHFPTTRLEDEKTNVAFDAYLVAFGHEGDNDFHCILSTTPDISDPGARFMTAEVSGLAPAGSPSYETIKSARKDFLNVVQDLVIKTSGYTRVSHPVKVHVTGALYFDGEHADDPIKTRPGPNYAKPGNVWEVHPVTGMRVVQ